MEKVLASVALMMICAGCGGPSTSELVARCDSMFNGIASNLEDAIREIDEGEDAKSVLKSYQQPIEELASNVSKLRKDLASGGQRHDWSWPFFMRSEAVIRYEKRLGKTMGDVQFLYEEADSGNDYALAELPDSILALGQIGRTELKELRWFCNRAAWEELPKLSESSLEDFVALWRIKGQAGYDTEIMRAIQSDEEAEAFSAYLIWRESL